jgi:hypothetical protein
LDGDGGVAYLDFVITVKDVNYIPSVEIISPANGSMVKRSFFVSGRATDDNGMIEWVRFRIDEGDWTVANGTDPWTLAIDTDGLKPGLHVLYVRCYDGVSESSIQSIHFQVTRDIDTPSRLDIPLALIIITIVLCIILLPLYYIYISKGNLRS